MWSEPTKYFCPSCGAQGTVWLRGMPESYRCTTCEHRWKMREDPGGLLRHVLHIVLDRDETRSADIVPLCGITIQNASNKLTKLWQEGFISRAYDTAFSGGREFRFFPPPAGEE